MNNERYTTANKLIDNLFNVQITPLTTPAQIQAFCNKYSMHDIQYCFNFNGLSLICSNLTQDYIYHYVDSLMVNFYIFTINGTPYVLSPYITMLITQRDIKTILEENNSLNINTNQLQNYYNSLPLLNNSDAKSVITAFWSAVFPTEPVKPIKEYRATDLIDTQNIDKTPISQNLLIIEERYTTEQRFLENIKSGNVRASITNLKKLEESVSNLKRIGTTLENERIGAAVSRTSVRLAALQAGLPPLIIDNLSNIALIEVLSLKSVEAIRKSKEKMVISFCKAIQRMKTEKYSALVQSSLYFLETKYSSDISLDELAKELSISKNHLISCFKKEVGTTPIAYLTKIRMNNSAFLLTTKKISISEISQLVGISDPNYFVKLFKKEFGLTPTQYRNSTEKY